MTARLVIVAKAGDAPAPAPDQAVLVADTSWRTDESPRDDLYALGSAVRRVLAARDPFTDARELLDSWAAAVDLDEATAVDGVAWWYRHRLAIWLILTDYLHWRSILDEFSRECWPTQTLVVPAAEKSLVDVARLLAARDGLTLELSGAKKKRKRRAPAAPATSRRDDLWESVLRRLGRLPEQQRERELGSRREVLRARIAALRAEGGGRLLVLVAPRIAQSADLADGTRLVNPFLEPVLRACAGTRLDPVTVSLGATQTDDEAWASIESSTRLLPESVLAEFWAEPGDEGAAKQTGADIAEAVAALPRVPLEDGGVDFSADVRRHLARLMRVALPKGLLLGRRAERMMKDLRPAGLLLINEYSRREYVVAARRAGLPSFAVQHGIIYPGHVGYVYRRTPSLVMPTRTFVFGAYESEVLRHHGGYTDDEVEVTGAPRIAFVASGDLEQPMAEDAREAVRLRLGVAPGHRMLVISTTHEQMHRRFYWANCLDQLLDGPLPDVHLVFKQHPAEVDDGGYLALVEGIARRAGVTPPPVTVVRDIDLFTLLRAADAHLGLFSTVLTDAVAAGTPNLVATTQARQDLLGYVAAGVAVPVSSHAELREALGACAPPTPAARQAFLVEHMRPGDAPSRIRDAILAATDEALVRDAAGSAGPAATQRAGHA